MDNDLFSTTEALNNAYKEVLKKQQAQKPMGNTRNVRTIKNSDRVM